MLDLAIVIVSFNTCRLLEGCLRSLWEELARSGQAGEVWVVDNASTDGSASMVRARFPEAHVLALESNRGFAGANNVALAAISGRATAWLPKYVWLLNPDTTLVPGALSTLLGFMEARPEVGLAGPQLRYPDGGFQHAAFRFPSLAQLFLDFFPLHYRLIHSRLNGRYPRAWVERGEPFAVDHPLGAAMMARWEAVQAVGPLDERFFMYCEEIDWCWRLKAAGWRIACVPGAVVVHHEAQSTRQFAGAMFVQLWRSRFLLFRIHYPPWFRWAVRRLVLLGTGAEMRRARRAWRRGDLSDGAYRQRLEALWQVRGMEG